MSLRRFLSLTVALSFITPVHGSNQTPEVVAPPGGAGSFGRLTAFDGTFLVSGNSNFVYVFDDTGSVLHQLLVPAGNFANASSLAAGSGVTCLGVAIDNENGDGAGAVQIFETGTGTHVAKAVASDGVENDSLGRSVAVDGLLVLAGAPAVVLDGKVAGAAYLFDLQTGTQVHKLIPSTPAPSANFGQSTALAGTIAVVGAPYDPELGASAGAVFVYDAQTGIELHKLLADDGQQGDQFGISVAIRGTTILIGAEGDDDSGSLSGSAYVFDALSGDQVMKLTANDGDNNDFFGSSVALGPSNRAMVGAHRDNAVAQFGGSAYLFDLNTGAQLAKYLPTQGQFASSFGSSVAFEERIAVGAPGEQLPGVGPSGSVTLFSTTAPPLSYCTAKTSSAGCIATIASSGPCPAPISGDADFSITASNVQELKNGLIFASLSGAAALPFNGGTLCMFPPTKRGPILTSGGDNPTECDGTFATLVNTGAVIPAGLDAGSGNTAWYQYWYRDPQNGAGQLGTALSNALQVDFE